MVQAKFLRYVAVPTNRRMRFQHVPELIYLDLIPGQQLSTRCDSFALKVGNHSETEEE